MKIILSLLMSMFCFCMDAQMSHIEQFAEISPYCINYNDMPSGKELSEEYVLSHFVQIQNMFDNIDGCETKYYAQGQFNWHSNKYVIIKVSTPYRTFILLFKVSNDDGDGEYQRGLILHSSVGLRVLSTSRITPDGIIRYMTAYSHFDYHSIVEKKYRLKDLSQYSE